MKLFIEASREAYSPSQISHTLTVGDLIEILSDYDEDTLVYTSQDSGYTCGRISYDSFREEEGGEEG